MKPQSEIITKQREKKNNKKDFEGNAERKN